MEVVFDTQVHLRGRFGFIGRVAGLVALFAVVLSGAAARAQSCLHPQWQPGEGIPGLDGVGYATTMWDPDGPGPRQPCLVIAGNFQAAGTTAASNIASWNVSTGEWLPIGSGTNGSVYTVAAMPDGGLVIGGAFTMAGGVPANRVARLNSATGNWMPLGTGITSGLAVFSVVALPNGNVFAAGSFDSAGGVSAKSIAQWNATTGSWSPLGSGIAGGSPTVYTLALLPNGDLIAGGEFYTAGGVVANTIARWNGSAWVALGTGMADGGGNPLQVRSLLVLPGGDVVAAGNFALAGGVPAQSVARWNGTNWSPLGLGINRPVNSITALPNGDLIAGGYFATHVGSPGNSISRWNGTLWSPLNFELTSGTPSIHVYSVAALPNGELVAAGDFSIATPAVGNFVAKWNNASGWASLSAGIDDTVLSLAVTPGGDLIAAGRFTRAGNIAARWIGRRLASTNTWLPMGLGMSGGDPTLGTPGVYSLAVMPDGKVIAGGNFTVAGGTAANFIASWNGADWLPVGAGMNGPVHALLVLANGDLIAGGSFNLAGGVTASCIARWNGTAWTPLGSGLTAAPNAYVPRANALAVQPNGDFVAAGNFTTAGSVIANGIARWNGTEWKRLGGGLNGTASTLVVLGNGDIIAGGSLTSGGTPDNRVMRWNGTSWDALGSGVNHNVAALAVLPTGELIAAGWIVTANGATANNIVAWNATSFSWIDLGGGISGVGSSVAALTVIPGDGLVAGGKFSTAGGGVSGFWATYGCPSCYPNCDHSTAPPTLNVNDFQCFLNRFAKGDPYANCDQSTTMPTLTAADFQCFLNEFVAGCV